MVSLFKFEFSQDSTEIFNYIQNLSTTADQNLIVPILCAISELILQIIVLWQLPLLSSFFWYPPKISPYTCAVSFPAKDSSDSLQKSCKPFLWVAPFCPVFFLWIPGTLESLLFFFLFLYLLSKTFLFCWIPHLCTAIWRRLPTRKTGGCRIHLVWIFHSLISGYKWPFPNVWKELFHISFQFLLLLLLYSVARKHLVLNIIIARSKGFSPTQILVSKDTYTFVQKKLIMCT